MVGKRSGKVAYAVLSFGGFLGMGSSYRPLPWEQLTYEPSRSRIAARGAPVSDSEASLWDDPLVIIAQYQRMSHYGLAGFSTAAAYAETLGEKDGAAKLKAIVKDIYKADEFTSQLAERAERQQQRRPDVGCPRPRSVMSGSGTHYRD